MSAIQAADVPTLNQNTTGSAATLTTGRTVQTNLASTTASTFNGSANITPGVTGTLAIANGGTGAITAQAAINALAGSTTSGQYLRGNGTNVVMSAIQAADVPTLNQNTTGTASNVTGIVAITNGGTGSNSIAFARANLTGARITNTGGITTFVFYEDPYYQVFTGTQNQTVEFLPATSLQAGVSYRVINNSTGTLTLRTSNLLSLGTVLPGFTVDVTVINTSSDSAASWEVGYTNFSSITGTGSAVSSTQPSFNSTIGVGGATAAASGAGISFPTTTSSSSDANTLDDYEEGTWTPTLTGNTTAGTYTFSTNQSYYTKIGRIVFCSARLTVGTATGGTGTAKFGGLPFSKGTNQSFAGSVRLSGIDLDPTCIQVNPTAWTTGSSTEYGFSQTVDNGAAIMLDIAGIASSDIIDFSIFYTV